MNTRKLYGISAIVLIGIFVLIMILRPKTGNGENPACYIEMGASYETVKAQMSGQYPNAECMDEKGIVRINVTNYNGVSGTSAEVTYWCPSPGYQLDYIRVKISTNDVDKIYKTYRKQLTANYGKPYFVMNLKPDKKNPASFMRRTDWLNGRQMVELLPMDADGVCYLLFTTQSQLIEDMNDLKKEYETGKKGLF